VIVGSGGAAVPSLRAAPYPVAARRRAVTVLVTPLHVDEPAPAALVGVDFFFFFLCGRTRAACSAITAPCLFFFWPMANWYAIAETQRGASAASQSDDVRAMVCDTALQIHEW